jgi:hypothetical protein
MKLLAGTVPESDMLIFGPQDPKYTVTVFTDVDCPYCRKLHSQIAEYNRLGVRVRYMFYPAHRPEHRILDQGGAGVVLGQPQRGAHPGEAGSGLKGTEEPAEIRR